ncbi:MAG: hypothetical protein EKK55_07055 [Rhodocyclaceae bacterium]|nr:MAG: hypothetical protein EKK55_07055 [Rhodocyclaceae bacterium]
MNARTYTGSKHPQLGPTVTVDGAPLPPRLDILNRSPDGFNWGYGGAGPTQLAVAILADHLEHCPDDVALLLQLFGLPPACDVCGGPGTLAPAEVHAANSEERTAAWLAGDPRAAVEYLAEVAALDDAPADPCWNCQGDGERSFESLVARGAQRLRGKLIAPIPITSEAWSFGTVLVHATLKMLAADAGSRRLQAARADQHGAGCTGKLRGGPVDCPGGGAGCPGSGDERELRE